MLHGVLSMLEPDEGKLSRPVLRGLGDGNILRLPDTGLPLRYSPAAQLHIRGLYINIKEDYGTKKRRIIALYFMRITLVDKRRFIRFVIHCF